MCPTVREAIGPRPQDRDRARLDAIVNLLPVSALRAADRPYGDLGVAYAMVGRVDRARAVLAQMAVLSDTALRRFLTPDTHRIRAAIALAEHRPLDAVSEFRYADTRPDGPVSHDTAFINLWKNADQDRQPQVAAALGAGGDR